MHAHELTFVEHKDGLFSFRWDAGPPWCRFVALEAPSEAMARIGAVDLIEDAMAEPWLRGRNLASPIDGTSIVAIDRAAKTVTLEDGRRLDEAAVAGLLEAEDIAAGVG
jgi:hypothetical protein